LQPLVALKDVHACSFVHRDVKPANFAIGVGSSAKRTLYVLDFGLARSYLIEKGGVKASAHVCMYANEVYGSRGCASRAATCPSAARCATAVATCMRAESRVDTTTSSGWLFVIRVVLYFILFVKRKAGEKQQK